MRYCCFRPILDRFSRPGIRVTPKNIFFVRPIVCLLMARTTKSVSVGLFLWPVFISAPSTKPDCFIHSAAFLRYCDIFEPGDQGPAARSCRVTLRLPPFADSPAAFDLVNRLAFFTGLFGCAFFLERFPPGASRSLFSPCHFFHLVKLKLNFDIFEFVSSICWPVRSISSI